MGWGVFYWVVNIGAMLAPIIATMAPGQAPQRRGLAQPLRRLGDLHACNLFLC